MILLSEFFTRQWAGGETTELLIAPKGATYEKRDFDFRLSHATLPVDKSCFTSLPGIRRILLLLEGRTCIEVNGQPHELLPGQQLSFSGDDLTYSQGAGRDFNLMMKAGVEGSLGWKELKTGEKSEFLMAYVFKGTGRVGDEVIVEGTFLDAREEGNPLYFQAVSDIAQIIVIDILE